MSEEAVVHEMVGPPYSPSCSCGQWEVKLGESIWRSFDKHLIAVAGMADESERPSGR